MIGAIIAKRKVRSAFESLNKRDLRKFMANWAEDCIFIYPGSASVSGKWEGKKAVEQWFQKMMDQFPKFKFTLKNILVQNIFALGGTNVIAVEWALTLTNREERDFHNNGISVIHVKGGKAVLVVDYMDTEVLKRSWGEVRVDITIKARNIA